MKIWFKNSDPAKAISLGKSVGETDESFFEYNGEPVHGLDEEFYDIVGNKLIAKTQAAVDAIKAQRKTDAQTAAAKKAARIAEIKNNLTAMTTSQLDSYIDANVTDLASAKVYLKRLTLIVRHLAKEQGS